MNWSAWRTNISNWPMGRNTNCYDQMSKADSALFHEHLVARHPISIPIPAAV
jgi:hypothetical protein